MKIGIVGGGFVGSATALLECEHVERITYDLDPARCFPAGTKKEDLLTCDVVFVCVPTPSYDSGKCNTKIVEACITDLKATGVKNIVLRSTVPPGTSAHLGVDFMPEFLTEANWRNDFYECSQWIFGVESAEVKDILTNIFNAAAAAGKIRTANTSFIRREEAEMVKYVRNNFLATKISFFNEIEELCRKLQISYENVQKGVVADGRIGASHTMVPGYDGHRGFGGTCLPKDTNALVHIMESAAMTSYIVKATVNRNILVDRPERDWESDPRAFTRT